MPTEKKIILRGWTLEYFSYIKGMKDMKKIFAFEDSVANVAAYQALGFDVMVDDAANGIHYVETDLTDYDWLAALALLEDCQREGLQPAIQHDGKIIDWEDAIEFADKMAAAEPFDENQ